MLFDYNDSNIIRSESEDKRIVSGGRAGLFAAGNVKCINVDQ